MVALTAWKQALLSMPAATVVVPIEAITCHTVPPRCLPFDWQLATAVSDRQV
jgi:hypothetical protein